MAMFEFRKQALAARCASAAPAVPALDSRTSPWLTAAVAGLALAFLCIAFGVDVTRSARVQGVLVSGNASDGSQARLVVPARAARFLRNGETFRLRVAGRAGADPGALVGTVLQRGPGVAAPGTALLVVRLSGPLRPGAGAGTEDGRPFDAELEFGSRSLTAWLRRAAERPGEGN
jgi:anti-sigma-K factor RskA